MEVYYELLKESGINITKSELNLKEIEPIKKKAKQYPEKNIIGFPYEEINYKTLIKKLKSKSLYNPNPNKNLKIESNVTNINSFIKIETSWYKEEKIYGINYDDEIKMKKKVVHTYDRILRFKYIFYHLIGCKGSIKENDFIQLKNDIGKKVITCKFRNYNIIYKYLKLKKWNQYYISIPFILNKLGAKRWNLSSSICIKIIKQFTKLHHDFNSINKKEKNKRSKIRFPKLQYIALRLLQDENIYPPYHIPIARTIKKRKHLNPIYKKMKERIL
jgi:hypothetical protein